MDLQGQNGLMRTYRESWRRRGVSGWIFAIAITGFYCVLYFTEWLTPTAVALGLQNKWYLYGAGYTVAMIAGGAYYLRHHGNSRYNQFRIATNIAVQVILAFCLPFAMTVFFKKDFYFSYLWPLKIEYLYPSTLEQYPVYIAVYSVLASLVAVPTMAYFFGKRWYCSWVCGCGGLANTFGDPWRHLGDKRESAWRFEKVSVHTVMVLALLSTGLVLADSVLGPETGAFHSFVDTFKGAYGFVVGAMLAGVVGVGLYPVMGPRVWCRNFCPMAAMLGLMQKVGRFQIRVKENMCISCGNCSSYCEMGIDVRAYAQRNESFTRAACVGCGMCAHVCPRGVLKLENVSKGQRKKRSLPMAA